MVALMFTGVKVTLLLFEVMVPFRVLAAKSAVKRLSPVPASPLRTKAACPTYWAVPLPGMLAVSLPWLKM